MAEYLADVDVLAARLNVPVTDPVMLAALRGASQRFRTAVGHTVSRVDNEEIVLDGDGSTVLVLPSPRVIAVHSVTVDGSPVTVEWSQSGTIRYSAGFPDAWGAVRVVYSHGWEPVPDDVAEAVMDAAEMAYHATPGLESMTVGGESLRFASGGVTQGWADTVEAYKVGGAR